MITEQLADIMAEQVQTGHGSVFLTRKDTCLRLLNSKAARSQCLLPANPRQKARSSGPQKTREK